MRKLALAAVLLLVLAVPASATTSRILAPQDWWPVPSPDGSRVAFTRVHPNHMELELVDLRSGRVSQVGTSAGQLLPSWSPDGTTLAYQSGGNIWSYQPRSGAKRYLGRGAAPAFGPQLARLLAGNLVVGKAVWATHVIGHPAWSPDRSKLAFRRDDGVYVSSGPGGARKLFGVANPGDPAWSPGGAAVAFAAGSAVWVAGAGAVPAYAAARNRPDASTPSWSPDGSKLAFSWRAGVDVVTLPTHAVAAARPAGVGVGYLPSGTLAFSKPRAACPGHDAIAVGARIVSGSCLVPGTARADVIEGTPLWGDVIQAGAGNDRIHANDRHTDRVSCGPGRDTVWADRADRLTGCEVVYR